MAAQVSSETELAAYILTHLLQRIESTPALDEPFSHIYLEGVFPEDVYQKLLSNLPEQSHYNGSAERHYGQAGNGFVRWMFALTPARMAALSAEQQTLFRGLVQALTAPALKRAMYRKLARDLAFRYGISEAAVADLAGYTRPTLYRETAGFEIPPHPDTRKKIVTMQLYWPADTSQVDLGTALYRRKLLGWPLGGWQNRFEKVKQFPFRPNSGYAFVVNNTLTRKSWHGRELLPEGAGIRNTLLNTFYEAPREEFRHWAA